MSRARLIVEGGRELYIEPVVVEVAGDQVLLAGRPSYLFRKRERGARADLESTDIVFGAIITRDGTARTVAAPNLNHGRVAAVAATAVGPGRWRVILAESDSVAADAGDVVPAYWHAVYDGAEWSEIERLPSSPGMSLQYFNSSRLIQRSDTVVWAAVVDTGRTWHNAIVFERIRGAWSHSIPTTPFATRVELVHTPLRGFVLGVFRHRLSTATLLPNSVESSEPQNSLYLYSRRSGWQLQRSLALPPNRVISRERLNTSGEVIGVTSIGVAPGASSSAYDLGAIIGSVLEREEERFVVDSNATPHFAPVVTAGGDIMWLSWHRDASADSTAAGELRLIHRSGDAPKVLWRTPHPYVGPFDASGYGADEVWVVGPELDQTHELLVSLIIRLRVDCSADTKGR